MSDTIAMTELELAMRKLANQVKLDVLEACAKIAGEAEENRASADSPYDNGSGSCGYAKACYDIERAIRALMVSRPANNSEAK